MCKVHIFLGPVCDYAVAPVARYWPYWHKPVLTVGAMAHDFGADKHAEYGRITRVGVTFDSMSRAITAVFKIHNWNSAVKVPFSHAPLAFTYLFTYSIFYRIFTVHCCTNFMLNK